MATLPTLTPDELLSTTKAVRRRLDLSRPVEREVIEDCLRLAQQAPHEGNMQRWHVVVVTDPDERATLAQFYRTAWTEIYPSLPMRFPISSSRTRPGRPPSSGSMPRPTT